MTGPWIIRRPVSPDRPAAAKPRVVLISAQSLHSPGQIVIKKSRACNPGVRSQLHRLHQLHQRLRVDRRVIVEQPRIGHVVAGERVTQTHVISAREPEIGTRLYEHERRVEIGVAARLRLRPVVTGEFDRLGNGRALKPGEIFVFRLVRRRAPLGPGHKMIQRAVA